MISKKFIFNKNISIFEWDDKDKKWYKNGLLHREDGPAIEGVDGLKAWFIKGKLHRKDGPAVEWPDGSKYWYKNGFFHREDGPAIENSSGYRAWFINGKEFSEFEFNKKIKKFSFLKFFKMINKKGNRND